MAIRPLMSGLRAEDEALYIPHHHHWQQTLLRSLNDDEVQS